ncbi:calcium-binding allergen Bet v 3-like [Impatiens glandulifera]|uniref:calcium-binding allergen Bet v 3-like n=1 Tax=Impatiens glandulifera TaxID=253017 RepID=UPI001FB0CB3D|nr:calcium-binding allergen Bet v 3-like [Impatiens glandulifera]
MESAIDKTTTTKKPSLVGMKGKMSSSSFRLRSSSLNALRLHRIFDLFDKNKDGMITVDELSQALNRLGLETDVSELSVMVNSHIRDGKIGLGFEEFDELHRSLNDTFFGLDQQDNQDEEESDLNEAFKVFDEDGDGYISASELQKVLGKLGFSEGREIDRCKRMILSVDHNHDGRVDFYEFKDMMRSTILVNSS